MMHNQNITLQLTSDFLTLCLSQMDFLLSHAAWIIASSLPSQFNVIVNMSGKTDPKAACQLQTLILRVTVKTSLTNAAQPTIPARVPAMALFKPLAQSQL